MGSTLTFKNEILSKQIQNMPILDFQTILSPLIVYTSDNNEHS
jgi:hypothetical protein